VNAILEKHTEDIAVLRHSVVDADSLRRRRDELQEINDDVLRTLRLLRAEFVKELPESAMRFGHKEGDIVAISNDLEVLLQLLLDKHAKREEIVDRSMQLEKHRYQELVVQYREAKKTIDLIKEESYYSGIQNNIGKSKVESRVQKLEEGRAKYVETIEKMKRESNHLKKKIKTLEGQLMDVPRSQEKFARTAMQTVKSKEKVVHEKEAEFARMGEENKTLFKWQNKAHQLEAKVNLQQRVIGNLKIELRRTQSFFSSTLAKKDIEAKKAIELAEKRANFSAEIAQIRSTKVCENSTVGEPPGGTANPESAVNGGLRDADKDTWVRSRSASSRKTPLKQSQQGLPNTVTGATRERPKSANAGESQICLFKYVCRI
jgi:hypothetical protein